MPQHATAELDPRARPRTPERSPRRAATAAAPVGDAVPTETVQRALDESPRVAALERMGEALAQRKSANGPVVQRRVGPDEGRPGMEVRVRANGKAGYLRGRVRNRDGEHVGWVVQTQVRVDDDPGTQQYLFDEVDPVGAMVSATNSSSAPTGMSSDVLLPPLFSLPPSFGLGLGTGLGPLASTSMLGTGAPSPSLTGGPLLGMSGPTATSNSTGVTVTSGSPSTSAPPVADSVVREGDGVQFTVDNVNWHDGYVTLIEGSTYHVYVDGKLIRDHLGYSTVKVPARQVRTSPSIKARMGAKRTKSSKREYRADRLASPEQVREVQGQYASVSPLLLRHPVLFGPVLRSGGHTGTEAVSAVGKDRGLSVSMPLGTKGKSRNRTLTNAIVATDTNAMLVTRLDDASTGPGQWVLHGKATARDAADHPTLNETQLGATRSVDLAAFRRSYVFSQGATGGEGLTDPRGRKQMHAEAKALRSPTWRHIVEQTVAEFTPASSSSASASTEPVAETRRKVIAIVINRSSCGSAKKGSGYTGGCAQELADVIAAFWATLGERLGVERAARLRAQGIIRIEVSGAGQYEYEGAIERTAAAGARLALHPNYDFDRDMPEPLSVARYQYLKRLALINAGRASGSGSGSDSGSEEDSELARLLALIAQMRAPVRRPRSRVAHPLGQHQVTGMFNRGHSGRIACTSIAACALEQVLNSPGERVDQRMLMTLMAAGTDVDADLRRNLGGGGPPSGSGGGSSSVFKVPAPKRSATARAMPSSPLLSSPLLPSLLPSFTFGSSSQPLFPQPAPLLSVERPLTTSRSQTLPRPSPVVDMVLESPSTVLSPPSLLGPRATTMPSSDLTMTNAPQMGPPPLSSLLLSLLPSPTSNTSPQAPRATTSTVSAPSESQSKKRSSPSKRERSESPDERYFAHDEVQAQFPGMRVDQAAIDAAGPQYLYGVRGDYRRIARQLTRGGPRTGLLVTIGGATIMVANVSTRDRVRFALFDSHGQAVFETYDTELGLAEAIEDLYPALPGVDEMNAAWYATPYRPT
jgi:hypothetical protein